MKNEVLIIASEFPPGPGGIGSHAYSMAKAFYKKNIEVTVVCPADYVDRKEALEFDSKLPFKVVRYAHQGWKGYLCRLTTIRKHLKKNIILSGKFPLWTIYWIRLLKKHNAKVICVLHGSEINPSNSFLRRFTHCSINSSDCIVAVSSFTKELLPEWIKRKRDIDIIPNGIDIDTVVDIQPIQLVGYPKLLTVGNVTPRKGQHRVIKALPRLIQDYPDIHYHIVGLPSYKEEFQQLAKSLNVANHVTFHGRVKNHSDLTGYYKSADAFIILSENQKDGDCEGFGIVILEAGMWQLPSIGAIGCGISDAISEGENGFMVDGDNPEEINKAIGAILEDKDNLQKGSRIWSEKFDWNSIIEKFIVKLKS